MPGSGAAADGGGTIDVGTETMAPVPGTVSPGVLAGVGVAPPDVPARGLEIAPASAGNSSDSEAGAPFAPTAAPRGCTDCSTRSPSIAEPTLKPRAGLPSTAIKARPELSPLSRGAATPSSLKREANAGSTGAAASAAAAGAPKTVVRSGRAVVVAGGATVYGGAAGDEDHSRNSQKTAVAATAAQITKANRRACISPL